MNSIFIECEFEEAIEGGGTGSWRYKIQKVLFATPHCKIPPHKKNDLPKLYFFLHFWWVGFFLLCIQMLHEHKVHIQVAI